MKLVRSIVVENEAEGEYAMVDDHNLKRDVLQKLHAAEGCELEHVEINNMRLFYTNTAGPVLAVRLSPKTGGNVSMPVRKKVANVTESVWALFEQVVTHS